MKHTHIFVNLPVRDLERSKRFFGELGYSFDPRFTDEKAACMVVGDAIYVMLLAEPFFRTFTSKEICDARRSTEVLVALSVERREEVHEVVARAVAAGGRAFREPQDHGFMLQHAFEDPDGHVFELVWMDPAAAERGVT